MDIQAEGDQKEASVRARLDLAEMLAGVTPEAMGAAYDWGEDLGRERVE